MRRCIISRTCASLFARTCTRARIRTLACAHRARGIVESASGTVVGRCKKITRPRTFRIPAASKNKPSIHPPASRPVAARSHRFPLSPSFSRPLGPSARRIIMFPALLPDFESLRKRIDSPPPSFSSLPTCHPFFLPCVHFVPSRGGPHLFLSLSFSRLFSPQLFALRSCVSLSLVIIVRDTSSLVRDHGLSQRGDLKSTDLLSISRC